MYIKKNWKYYKLVVATLQNSHCTQKMVVWAIRALTWINVKKIRFTLKWEPITVGSIQRGLGLGFRASCPALLPLKQGQRAARSGQGVAGSGQNRRTGTTRDSVMAPWLRYPPTDGGELYRQSSAAESRLIDSLVHRHVAHILVRSGLFVHDIDSFFLEGSSTIFVL